jgi:hypothetical protein
MNRRCVCAVLIALSLAGCADGRSGAGDDEPAASSADRALDPPYKPVATNLELMESIIAHAAEEYWGAVRIIVDEDGITEEFPETDEDWEEVWAAGLSIAESGNLLMMPPRAVDEEWIRISGALVDVGLEAARAALARDTDAVLEAGEQVYYVCVECHDRYIPLQ